MSDSHQAIYDAVRSRISSANAHDAILQAAQEAFDFSYARALLQEQIGMVGNELVRPSVLFRPTVSLDGNMYCVLYGENLAAGCAGFGATMEAAMADFDKNWREQRLPSALRASEAARIEA
jgi:hypothetical protein